MQNEMSQSQNDSAVTSLVTEQAASAQDLVTNYLKSLSPKTLRRHENELKVLCVYLVEERKMTLSGDLKTDLAPWIIMTQELALDFVKWMRTKGYNPKSIITCLYTIKTYCRMASMAEILSAKEYERIRSIQIDKDKQPIPSDPVNARNSLSKKKSTPLRLSDRHVKQLLQQPSTSQGARDELLLSLLLMQGLWPTEIATLPVDAIDLKAGKLTVYRTLAREKQVHQLTKETLAAAQRYLTSCEPSRLLLMGSRKGGHLAGHMTDRAIHDRVRTLGARVELPTLSPQDCHVYWEQLSRGQIFSENESLPVRGNSPLESRRVKTQSDLFNRQSFEESLRQIGVPEQAISSLISDFRLFVPLLIKSLGEKQFLEIIARSSEDLRLSSQPESWQQTVQYLIQWAEEEVQLYEPAGKRQR